MEAIINQQLFEAIRAGDGSAVRSLLEEQPDLVRSRDEEGLSPLVVAAYWGQSDIVEILRPLAGDLDLFEAAIVGDTVLIQRLIAKNPDLVSSYSVDGFTALHLAVFFGQPDAARLLLERGADVAARTTNALANQPLHAAVAGSNPQARLRCARLLVEAGAHVNARQSGGFTPLMAAAQNGDEELASFLLESGSDPSARDDQGRSAADIARAAGHEQLAQRFEATA